MAQKLVTFAVSDGNVTKEFFRVKRGSRGDFYIEPSASKTKQGAHVTVHASGEIHVTYDPGMKYRIVKPGAKPLGKILRSMLPNLGVRLAAFQGCRTVHTYYLDNSSFPYLSKRFRREPNVRSYVIDLTTLPSYRTGVCVLVTVVTSTGWNELLRIASMHGNTWIYSYKNSQPWLAFLQFCV